MDISEFKAKLKAELKAEVLAEIKEELEGRPQLRVGHLRAGGEVDCREAQPRGPRQRRSAPG